MIMAGRGFDAALLKVRMFAIDTNLLVYAHNEDLRIGLEDAIFILRQLAYSNNLYAE